VPAPGNNPYVEVRVESPFPDYAVPRVWTWIQSFRHRVADDFAPRTLEEFVQYWERRKQADRTWGVWRGEDLGGLITIEELNPAVVSSHCLFKRSFWGGETTLEALRQVYSQIFDEGYQKIVSFAFRDNAQLLGLARKLGAEKEGVLRKQTVRDGKPVDMIAIGLLREDFMAKIGKQERPEEVAA